MSRKLLINDFIKISSEVHKNKYDYSITILGKNNKDKVEIICPIHGIFSQCPNNHMRGSNCPKCYGKNIKYTKESFIEKSISKFGDLYDYSLVNYKTNKNAVKIICKKHGEFEQSPGVHIRSKIPCFKCCTESRLHKQSEIIKLFKNAHSDRYDYSLVKYQKLDIKVKIICKDHGIFEQKPGIHLLGFGCKKCQVSKGELKIIKILEKQNIKYNFQHRFADCKNKRELPFDFYLPDYNICIEFNGKQHYDPVEYFGGEKSLLESIMRDKIKTKYCEDNNIKLITIKYDNDNMNGTIMSILEEFLE